MIYTVTFNPSLDYIVTVPDFTPVSSRSAVPSGSADGSESAAEHAVSSSANSASSARNLHRLIGILLI